MEGFLKSAAQQIDNAADKAAQEATAKFGQNVGDAIKKYGHEAGDKVSTMDPNQIESELGKHGIHIPNATTASKAAVPQAANPTTGNVVTKAGAVPAAGIAGPGAANPLTGKGAEEGTNTAS